MPADSDGREVPRILHAKSIRRRVLIALYDRYFLDPMDMLSPEDLMEESLLGREELLPNVYYLHDRQLVEVMIGYNPPMFAAARITAKGIDLVENGYEFNLLFPEQPGQQEADTADIPVLVERLVEEADFAALDGEARKCLLRDVQYLREELARPAARWRREVIYAVLYWLEQWFDEPEQVLPSLPRLRAALADRSES